MFAEALHVYSVIYNIIHAFAHRFRKVFDHKLDINQESCEIHSGALPASLITWIDSCNLNWFDIMLQAQRIHIET